MADNLLYYGDNLDILRRYIKEESIDLVYLDPPFKSNQDYNVLFAEQDGSRSKAQIKAFVDTWRWDIGSEEAYREVVEFGGKVSQVMQAFRTFLGENDMMAYLAMMAPRLIQLHQALKPSGSIYLHCDPTASHYLKMLMDAIFDPRNFRNEIVWRRTGSHNSPRRLGPIHDIILFYSKTGGYYFQRVFRRYLKGHVASYFKGIDERGRYWTNALTGAGTRTGQSGKLWQGYNPTAHGRHWAIPGKIIQELGIDEDLSVQEKLDELDKAGFVVHPPSGSKALPTYRQYLDVSPGIPLQDIWAYQPHTIGVVWETDEGIDEDVSWLKAQGDQERLGYPTQKPLGLLERIIQLSCPPKGVVLDPFCGCGTTIIAAQSLKRPWIGIDITHLAITLIKHRLLDTFGDQVAYEVIGEPVSLPDAEKLSEDDPYQFQWWVLGLVGARPIEQKKGADKGIDGRLYFHDEQKGGKTKQIIFSVKSGRVNVSHLRDLRGVLEREEAEIGVLLCLEEQTKDMRKEAATAGFYESKGWGRFARLQILTVEGILGGKKIQFPPSKQVNATFKKAQKTKGKAAIPLNLPFDEQ